MSATVQPGAAPAATAPAFPPGFRFGAATAAFQIEGATREDGRGESIWDRFCATPGKVAGGHTGEVACDHYHRWPLDLDLLASLGVESYRFSIAWPRVQPGGRGRTNPKGVAFYRRLVEGLLERGIEPIATLYHWDLPQALQDAGGWAERDTTARFAEYAEQLAGALGDLVTQWNTHNEPWVTAFLGHAEGRKAPGIRDWPTALRVSHHLLLSHGLAVDALRAGVPGAQVGPALNLAPVEPAGEDEVDRAAATRFDAYMNRWFLDPLLRGGYPEDLLAWYERHVPGFDAVRDGDLETIARPIDFLGINYYTRHRIAHDPGRGPLQLRDVPPDGRPQTAMGWEVEADGLRRLLARVREDYGPLPLYITENGAAFDDAPPSDGCVDDPERTAYLAGHLEALAAAIAEGADVRRYCVWSLLDNFEWEHGYGKRFGIVHVDYATQRRTPKRSGLFYRDYIAAARAAGEA